ncbi:MAG: [LysW]-lysine hydrolase [Ardenticatenaceae bacterium]|nr:[LysW]-lysine hydrolase [Ardenticatenaceae bacterium]MCB8988298.1 [LysW]-lysine hydrolase [Ardenticatenaceae bacterium]
MSTNPVEFLSELVAIESLSGEETAVAQFLAAHMAQLGLAAHIDGAGNAVGVREEGGENGRITREIILLGHMDTVPGRVPVRVADGKVYGRGAVDAKGPLATFVLAAARAKLPPGTRLVVIGATEEEAATSKGARFAATRYRPDMCIIGEPSGWDGVTLGYKGRVLIDYAYSQPMSHTAGQASGAAETGIAWLNQFTSYIAAYNQTRPRLFDQLLPSIRDIHTGSDGLTNTINIKLGVRLPPEFDVAGLGTAVREMAGRASLRFYGHEAAFQSTRQTPLARAFNRAIRQAGAKPTFKLKTGTSDMNVVGPIWQCPIVAYGPGDSSLDHTPEEHVVVDEYLQAIDVLQHVLEVIGTERLRGDD